MRVGDLITIERVAANAEDVTSKKKALERLSELLAQGEDDISRTEVFDSLIARERLGGTGLGHGVALPHGRVKNNRKTRGAFIQLIEGVDFDAIDQQPVDLLFALLVPEESTEEHLRVLAQLAEMFSSREFRERLREARTSEALYRLLAEWQEPSH
ncbi:PTS IIA-like nitrogen regulatory protein PtsN [Ectothiorhodospiraceae bacterium 2226]|nr:PTS IIA-like nitrogen regulatory protein PtsN [Ectothiorhodospiraceae bacterium 2226]